MPLRASHIALSSTCRRPIWRCISRCISRKLRPQKSFVPKTFVSHSVTFVSHNATGPDDERARVMVCATRELLRSARRPPHARTGIRPRSYLHFAIRAASESSHTAAMSPEERLLIGLFVVFVLANCACHFQLRRQKREWAELHAPLNPDSADRRLDAALREAEAGTTVCSGCGFENFHRNIFCSICGQIIGTLTKRQKKRMGREVILGNARRQLRARCRKEWTRKVDIEGNLYWYRDNAPLSCRQYAGHVVRFVRTHLDIQVVEGAQDSGLEAHARRIVQDHSRHVVYSEDPKTSDPTSFFSEKPDLEADPQLKHEYRQLVEHAQRDFPSKLAEFVTRALSLFIDSDDLVSVFHIHRASLMSDSIESLALLTPTQARAAIRVDFVDEQGIDAGGVYREWFLLLNEELVKPETGVFVCVDAQDQTFYLNPHSGEVLGESHLIHFLAAGRLMGRALLEGNVTGFHLALPLLKIILGLPVTFSDLEYYDPGASKSLKWLLENNDVDTLGLDFTVVEKLPSGKTRVVELVANGANIDVTDANKREYVDRKLQYLLVDSVSSQMFAFLQGLYEVVPAELLMLFDAEELDYVLSGSDEIDVDDWERHTKYSPDLWNHPTRQWFWELVREMPNEYRRRLLQFATGSSRAPLSGFSSLTSYDGRLCPFTLVGMPLVDEGFVRSHACFNRLDVPRHVNKACLKKGLYALLDTEMYGFSTA